jgi:hypothetical protein
MFSVVVAVMANAFLGPRMWAIVKACECNDEAQQAVLFVKTSGTIEFRTSFYVREIRRNEDVCL